MPNTYKLIFIKKRSLQSNLHLNWQGANAEEIAGRKNIMFLIHFLFISRRFDRLRVGLYKDVMMMKVEP
jgi:hypothetical protein